MIVLDASALAKLVLEEEQSQIARELVAKAAKSGEKLAAPDIALAEVLNTLWKHHQLLHDLSEESYWEAIEDLLSIWDRIQVYSTRELAKEASSIAAKLRQTIYDSLYLSLAKKLGAELMTFDRLLRKAAAEIHVSTVPSDGQARR